MDFIGIRRTFQTDEPAVELELNSPRQWRPKGEAKRGIILVHGLGDSPFNFVDLGPRLAEAGFLVRTLLLPGNGTNPQDLLDITVEDWEGLLKNQAEIMKREVHQVYLGGFSTGANLAFNLAVEDPDIAGLVLFSPAFKSNSAFDWLTPLLARVKPWILDPAERTRLQTRVRYAIVPTNAMAVYYKTSAKAQKYLSRKSGYDKPAILVSVEHDSVVDVQYAAEYFRHFTNPHSRLIWYGRPPEISDPRLETRPDNLPEERISGFSHMCVVFAPGNPHYGRNGSDRLCRNGQSAEAEALCEAGGEVWYSDWGHVDEDPAKPLARLTYNPYFEWQLGEILKSLDAAEENPI